MKICCRDGPALDPVACQDISAQGCGPRRDARPDAHLRGARGPRRARRRLSRVAGIARGDRVAVLARNGHHVLEPPVRLRRAGSDLRAVQLAALRRRALRGGRRLCAGARPCTSRRWRTTSGFARSRSMAPGRTRWRRPGLPRGRMSATTIRGPSSTRPARRRAEGGPRLARFGARDDARCGRCLAHRGPDGVLHRAAVLPCRRSQSLHESDPLHGGDGRATSRLRAGPRLDVILQRDVTHVCGVPAIFQFMEALPAWRDKRFDGLRIMIGGAPVPDGLVRGGARPARSRRPCTGSRRPARRCSWCRTARRKRISARWVTRSCTCASGSSTRTETTCPRARSASCSSLERA